jgi:GDPmannose 4,6-dehydratase
VRIALGEQQELKLGDLTARRDWGYAPEYSQALQWLLDVPEPQELVLATGQPHSVEELVSLAFASAGIPREGRVRTEGSLLRPGEPDLSYGDPRRAFIELGWEPKTSFEQLITLLVNKFRAAGRSGNV